MRVGYDWHCQRFSRFPDADTNSNCRGNRNANWDTNSYSKCHRHRNANWHTNGDSECH